MTKPIAKEQYIEVSPGHKLHITEVGNGRAVLLIPGLPMSDEIFISTYSALANAGYRAIGITLRGFGSSDTAEHYPIDLHVSDIEIVINTLELEDVVMAGYSYGGVIAAYYAAKKPARPISNLILISANVPKFTRSEDFPFGIEKDTVDQLIEFSQNNLPAMLDLYGPVFGLNESLMPLPMAKWLTGINLQTNQNAMTEGIMLLRDTDLRNLLGHIEVPTTIMHGRTDATVPYALAEQTKGLVQHADLVTFENGGHWFIFTHEDEFHNELLKAVVK